MQNKESNYLLLNKDTGEIVNEFTPQDRISVVRNSQDEYLKTHIINFNKGQPFVKMFDDVLPLLEKYLSLPEFKFAICLAVHVSFEDCIIRLTKDRTSKILTVKEIAELHNYKYEYTRKLMMNLKKKGIIGRHETGSILRNYNGTINVAYTVNPYIYFRGSDLLTPIHSFYQNSGWKELIEQDETKNQIAKNIS